MAKKRSKTDKARVVVSKNGPYLVSGGLPLDKAVILADAQGNAMRWGKGEKYPGQKEYALCRCGYSKNKPFCSGTHAVKKFVGTETADRRGYLEHAERIDGPRIVLTDAVALCSVGRFCHIGGGTWSLAQKNDEKSKKLAVREACDCPSGRLVAWDKKTGKAIEPKFKKSISLIEDPSAGASGPIWVKGGVPVVSADGKPYEVRNRVTLCRCGKSGNKPFCDGSHIDARFNDGDKSLRKK